MMMHRWPQQASWEDDLTIRRRLRVRLDLDPGHRQRRSVNSGALPGHVGTSRPPPAITIHFYFCHIWQCLHTKPSSLALALCDAASVVISQAKWAMWPWIKLGMVDIVQVRLPGQAQELQHLHEPGPVFSSELMHGANSLTDLLITTLSSASLLRIARGS